VSKQSEIIFFIDWSIGQRSVPEALKVSGAKVFSLVSGNLTTQQMTDLFVAVLGKLKKFTQGNQAPFIAKIYKDGKVQLWHNRTQLLKLLK
jgi:hypothetical protein